MTFHIQTAKVAVLMGGLSAERDVSIMSGSGVLKALQSKEIREKLASEGAEPVGSSPLEFANLIKSDYQKWAGVAKRAGIEPQ